MKFTLKHYRDLGRCSLGTLMDEFDTKRDQIKLKGESVCVESIEDLFPYLWQAPGISFHDRESKQSISEFTSKGTHWHRDYDKSIEEAEKHAKELEKRIKRLEKSPDPRSASKIESMRKTQKWDLDHASSLRDMCERLDREMKEQQRLLIEENKK